MLWKLFITSFLLGSAACAVHLEYLKVDLAEESHDETLDSVDQDLMMAEEQLPDMCWACGWAVKKVKEQIGNNATPDKIKNKLVKVCDSIGFLRSLCKKMIKKYLDILVEELSTTDDPKTICVNIGVCMSASLLKLIQVFSQNYQKV